MRRPTVARNGLRRLAHDRSTAPPGADRALDADRRRLAELDVDAEVVGQRRLDDLLLHLAVERDGELLPDVVLPHVDQRVLLGELGERDAERALVAGRAGNDDRLERRRREVVLLRVARAAAPIASPIRTSPRPQSLPICPARDRRALRPPSRASKTLIAVTFRSPSWPNRTRSRVRTVPENMRT